jgi:hypothetical protein
MNNTALKNVAVASFTIFAGLLIGYFLSTSLVQSFRFFERPTRDAHISALEKELGSTLAYSSKGGELPISDVYMGVLANEYLWAHRKLLFELSSPGQLLLGDQWSEPVTLFQPSVYSTIIVTNGVYSGQIGIGRIDPVSGDSEMHYPFSDIDTWDDWQGEGRK